MYRPPSGIKFEKINTKYRINIYKIKIISTPINVNNSIKVQKYI